MNMDKETELHLATLLVQLLMHLKIQKRDAISLVGILVEYNKLTDMLEFVSKNPDSMEKQMFLEKLTDLLREAEAEQMTEIR